MQQALEKIAFVSGPGTVWVAGIALLGVVALLFAVVLASRAQDRRHLREIARAAEELRSGDLRRRVEVEPGSPIAFLAAAVNQLGEELQARTREAQGAEERVRALLDAARDYALVVADVDGDIQSMSAAATEMFGWEEEEVLGRQASVLLDDKSWKELLPRLSRRSFRERGVESRARMVRKDGTVFQGQISVRLVSGTAGGASYFLLLAKDITSQVRLETELRESEARHRALFEGLAEGIFVVQGGTIVLANPALAALCGARIEDLEGKPLRSWIATRDVMVVEERLQALERRGTGQDEVAFTLLGVDGRAAAQVRMRASAVSFGAAPAVLGSLRDETTERAVESELRRNESRLDAVLEAASDGILLLAQGATGEVVRMTNQTFLQMFGLGQNEVLGATEGDLLRLLRGRGEGAEMVAAFLASGPRSTRAERVTLRGERARVLELRVAVLLGLAGAVLGRVLACRDITGQRAFERSLEANAEALARSKAELEASYGRLTAIKDEVARQALEEEQLNRELKALNEMKSNLLANVSHELQTPLVSIRGYTEMILRERLGSINEEQRKGLALSLRNIDRLISMIDSLVAFTRAPREATQLKLQRFALLPLIEESIELVRERARARRIDLRLALTDRGVDVDADRDKILQVFVNLLQNAVKFNREGGRVEVEGAPGRPGFVEVRVRDTGIGIPPDEIERIFDRNYRGRNAGSTGEEGSGIGLSLVRNILRMHGCSIHAESEEARGSTFTFTLPTSSARLDGFPEAEHEGVGEVAPPPMTTARGEPHAPVKPSPAPPPAHGEEDPGPKPRFRIVRRPKAGER